MERWLAYSIITLVLWGFWGVLLKRASEGLEWYQVYVYANSAIMLIIGLLILVYGGRVKPMNLDLSIVIAFLSGVTGTLGYIFLVKSLESGGQASIVIPLTSLYPLLTVLLSVPLLGEGLSVRKGVGVLLAVMAIVLLSE